MLFLVVRFEGIEITLVSSETPEDVPGEPAYGEFVEANNADEALEKTVTTPGWYTACEMPMLAKPRHFVLVEERENASS